MKLYYITLNNTDEVLQIVQVLLEEKWLSPKLCDKPNLLTTLHVRQKLWQTLFKGGFARVSVEK